MSELILPKVTVILRGYETKQVLSVVEQLVGTKVNSIEVASNSPHVAESIAAAKKEFGSEVHVGAGTVTVKLCDSPLPSLTSVAVACTSEPSSRV